jgi:hypothetical protein
MDDADRAGDFLNILPAGPAGTECFYSEVLWLKNYIHVTLGFRQHLD